MHVQELVEFYVEESLSEGAESARLNLYCRRDFISVTEDELLVAMAKVVSDANNDGGAKWWYLLIIIMGLLATGLSSMAAVVRNVPEALCYILGGVSAAGLVLAWQYLQYFRQSYAYPKKVAAICRELREALEQLGVVGRS